MPVTGNNPFSDKSLSIRIATDGFSFSTSQGTQDFAVPNDRSLVEVLEESLRLKKFVATEGQQAELLFDYPSTRVPLDEFRSEEAQSLYLITFGKNSLHGLNVRYEVLPGLEVVEIFPIDPKVLSTVQQYWPDVAVHGFYGQALLQILNAEQRREGKEQCLHACLSGHDVLLATFNNGRLQYANTYATDHMKGQQYFILRLWSQLEYDQMNDCLMITGASPELLASLKKFIAKIVCV